MAFIGASLPWLAAGTGGMAAALWFISASVNVPTKIQSGFGALVGVDDMSAGFKRSAFWNKWAAAITGNCFSFPGTIDCTSTILKGGVEFTNGGRPGVRMRKEDL